MTEQQARTTANVLMAAAAVGAAAFILRSPARRRLVWRLARQYALGPLAMQTAAMIHDAWDASASARPVGARSTLDRAPVDRQSRSLR